MNLCHDNLLLTSNQSLAFPSGSLGKERNGSRRSDVSFLEQLLNFRIQFFPEALSNTKLSAMVVVSARIEIYLDDAPLNAGEEDVEGKAGEHEQTLVSEMFSL